MENKNYIKIYLGLYYLHMFKTLRIEKEKEKTKKLNKSAINWQMPQQKFLDRLLVLGSRFGTPSISL